MDHQHLTPATPPAPPDGEHTTLALRGRDLLLHPPASIAARDDAALLSILLGAAEAPAAAARLKRDRRGHFFRARPIDFAPLKSALTLAAAYPLVVAFDETPALSWQPVLALTSRPYQDEALIAWRAAGYRGVIVLPTGGGKTFIGALAIADLNLTTLVVVPTIDLLRQWRAALAAALTCAPHDIGLYGGGDHDIQPITITTYESAQLHPEILRHFGLLIFDECHHLPAPTYRQIAEGAFTPHRLGLSATPERADQEHTALEYLIGSEVYRRQPRDLAASRHLADYDEQRIIVSLTPEARARYDTARAIYRDFVRRRRLAIRSPADFQRKILWAGARDPEARAAMIAWREARSLALDAPAKLAALEDIFARHRDERVLVFSEYNALVDDVAARFCIPRITHKTPPDERRTILERFRSGRYSKLVTGRVLNEGVDIPDCAVAVIVSGNSTRREYIQRLGRVLRPKATRAVLYELVTEDTTEERIADRRRMLASPPASNTIEREG